MNERTLRDGYTQLVGPDGLRCSLVHSWRQWIEKWIGGHVGYASVVSRRCLVCRTEWTTFIP